MGFPLNESFQIEIYKKFPPFFIFLFYVEKKKIIFKQEEEGK